jgi:hypothetical protein
VSRTVFGFGSRNPQLRSLRLVLLVAVIGAGVAFHHSGPAYTTIRIVYYAVLLGVIGYALYRRSASKHPDPGASGGPTPPPGPGSPSTLSGEPGSTPPAGLNPGWYPDHRDMKIQRYWDGSAWTGTRHWEENRWIER